MKRESSAGLGDVCASGQSFSPRGVGSRNKVSG